MTSDVAESPEDLLVSEGLAPLRDAMEFLGVCRSSIFELLRQGELPRVRIGVPRAAMRAFAAKRVEQRDRDALLDLALRIRDRLRAGASVSPTERGS
jgi:predicted DNA-binding transcriptional regulator AlpA